MGEDTGEKPERDPATGQFLAGNDPTSGPSTASHEPRVAPANDDARPQARSLSKRPGGQRDGGPPPGITPKPAFDDFEHPICQFCMGVGHVRDPEFGIKMVTCEYCEGKGRAPAP